MTPEQFERWKDFATRMALHAHPDADEGTRQAAAGLVREILDEYEGRLEDVQGWDGEGGKAYLCDDVANALEDYGHLHWNEESERVYSKAGGIAMSCVRAGVDVSLKPSAGVLGYDLADIRAMYPEGIPDWVAEFLPEGHDDEPGATGLWL